ncbi:MAG: amidohydrolase family protein, partial [Planctomycetes bacterium]|nr:amidohydrolase family protein [Planctomycetota bacterium]
MRQPETVSPATRSRRDFLRAGLLGAGAWALGSPGTLSAADRPAGYIDAHVHVWTPDLERYPLGPGYTKDRMALATFTPEELCAHARPCGVERIVLIQMSYYRFDNSYMLDMMKKHRGVFSGVAVIDPEAEPRKTMRELAAGGVRGFRIRPATREVDRSFDGEGMAAMWKCGADEGLAMCPLIDAKYVPAIDRMCERFGDTPVVVDHFARVGIDGVIRESDLEGLCRLARHKNTCVKVSAFYALGKKRAPYLDLGPMIRR